MLKLWRPQLHLSLARGTIVTPTSSRRHASKVSSSQSRDTPLVRDVQPNFRYMTSKPDKEVQEEETRLRLRHIFHEVYGRSWNPADLDDALTQLPASNPKTIAKGIDSLRRFANELELAQKRAENVDSTALTENKPGEDGQQAPVFAAYYRGGTSRGVIFREQDLPEDPQCRRSLFLQAIGSPDRHGRQLNGMGAGVSSLSKICIIKMRALNDPVADIDYTFVGMGIEGDEVDYTGNCGNLASAVGPYAFNQRMLPGRELSWYQTCSRSELRILNTNTGVVIRSAFETEYGQAKVDDSVSIDGVSGLGTKVVLDFLRPGGSKTGTLLPTGNVIDVIDDIQVSCIDSANPCVFVRASDVGIEPTILPAKLLGSPFKLHMLEKLRSKAAVLMGLCQSVSDVPRVIPKIAFVSPPVDQTVLSGELNPANSVDLIIRFISDGQPHRATPLTGALCTATAAKIPGSIVNQCTRSAPIAEDMITIGHPSGKIQLNATMGPDGDVECASVVRTARRLMEGRIYWNPSYSPPHTTT